MGRANPGNTQQACTVSSTWRSVTNGAPTELLDINTNPQSKAEVTKAITSLMTGKAASPDTIPPEAFVEIRHSDFNWNDTSSPKHQQVPENWKKVHLVSYQIRGICYLATTGEESCCCLSLGKYCQESYWRDWWQHWIRHHVKTDSAQTTLPPCAL